MFRYIKSIFSSPMRYLNFSLLIVALLFSCLTYLLFNTFHDIQSKNLKNSELTQLVEKIIYYDEVLTMSALMRVYSNDLSWEERYHKSAEMLDLALLSAANKLPETQKFIDKTSDANQRLISMETQAFSLANKGDSKASQQLLQSNAYIVDKQAYSKGITSLRKEIQEASKALMSDLEFQLKATAVISFLLCAFIIFSLVYAFRHLQHSVLHDSLTSLPNRLMLSIRLNQQLADTSGKKKALVAFLDLDGFKSINDVLGHATGDQLLQIVSKRFSSMQFPNYFVSRLGGDEFAFVAEVDNKQEAARFADMILNVFNDPIIVGGKKLCISASIGMSLCPDDGLDADTLIKNADTAMYYAKDGGKSRYCFYQEEHTLAARSHFELSNELQEAFQMKEFCVYYQPQYDLQTKQINGAEALLRWNHPKRGLLQPDTFIHELENSDLIVPVGEWVLHQACRQAKRWQQTGLNLNTIAVNISNRQIQGAGFVDKVKSILLDVDLEARFLELEVTEKVVMQEETIQTLEELRKLGVKLAIDDFGTGYSSMSQLKHLPVDKLKIDKSFVRGLPTDNSCAAIMKAIVTLGKSLKMRVCVEGVEEEAQMDFVCATGCDQVQGYYYSFPVPEAEFSRL